MQAEEGVDEDDVADEKGYPAAPEEALTHLFRSVGTPGTYISFVKTPAAERENATNAPASEKGSCLEPQ
jgi:hypothetical protein